MGSFEAIVRSVAEQLGTPYTDFPFAMFKYGEGQGSTDGPRSAVRSTETPLQPSCSLLIQFRLSMLCSPGMRPNLFLIFLPRG